jgi:hypothetical protein
MMTEYCCYCGEERGDKLGCCQENHFVPFEDLDDDMQKDILENIQDE